IPLLLIFFFASPWFQPWYMLWILPILVLHVTPVAFTLISIFLCLTPELFSPAQTADAFVTLSFTYYFCIFRLYQQQQLAWAITCYVHSVTQLATPECACYSRCPRVDVKAK